MTPPARRVGASPTTWRPFRGFEDIYSESDRLVQSLVGDAGGDGQWLPAADESDTADAYVVEIELPGARPGVPSRQRDSSARDVPAG